MAKAKAICKCRICGAEFEKTSTQCNRKTAEEWEKWASEHFDICPECWGKQKDAENAAAAAAAEKNGWPELMGSEKQIAWANAIRKNCVDAIEKKRLTKSGRIVLEFLLHKRISAEEWIEERSHEPIDIYRDYRAFLMEDMAHAEHNATLTGGNRSILIGGNGSKAKGARGTLILLVEIRDRKLTDYASAIVDGETIAENTFYKLENGQLVESSEN